jgi:cytoskeletal protein CcmA (bactofilin family)
MKQRKIWKKLAILAAFLAFSAGVWGTDYAWTGVIDGTTWENSGNWNNPPPSPYYPGYDGTATPTTTDTVSFISAISPITLSTAETVDTITIGTTNGEKINFTAALTANIISDGTNSITMAAGSIDSGSITSDGSTLTISGNVTGAITATSGSVTINGDLTNSGTLTLGGTLTVTGTIINTGTINCNGKAVSANTITNNGTIKFAGGETLTAPTKNNGTGTIEYTAAGAITAIWGSSYNNLTIDAGTLTLASPLTVTGTLINGGTLACSGQAVSANTITNNGTIKFAGGETLTVTTKDNGTGTIEYTAAGAITATWGSSYTNLKINTGTLTISGYTITGTLTNGGTITLGGPLTVPGLLTNTGTIAVGGTSLTATAIGIDSTDTGSSITIGTTGSIDAIGTIYELTPDASAAITLNGETTGLTISQAITGTPTITASGKVTLNGAVTGNITANGTVTVNNAVTGNITANGTVTVTGNVTGAVTTGATGSATLHGTGITTIDNQHLLTLDGATNATSATNEAGATLTLGGTLTLSGNFTNDGTFTPTGNTVAFTPTTASIIAGSGTTGFAALECTGQSGKTLTINSAISVGTLTLTGVDDSNRLTVNGSGSITLAASQTTGQYLSVATVTIFTGHTYTAYSSIPTTPGIRPSGWILVANANATMPTWIGRGGDAYWNTVGNWDTQTIPGAADAVTIAVPEAAGNNPVANGAINVTSIAVNSGTTLDCAGQSVTATSITNDGTVRLTDGGTWSVGSVTNNAGSTVEYYGGGTANLIAGTNYVNLTVMGAGTTLRTGTVSCAVSGTLTNGETVAINGTGGFTSIGTLTNNGTVSLSSSGAISSIGTLTNNNAISISGSGGIAAITAFTNNGTVTISGSGAIAKYDSAHGTIIYSYLTGGGVPALDGYFNLEIAAGSWSTVAALTINHDLTVSGGSLATGAVQTVTHDLIVSGGSLTANANLTASNNLTVSGGSLTSNANLTASNNLTVSSGSLTANVNLTVTSALAVSGTGNASFNAGPGATDTTSCNTASFTTTGALAFGNASTDKFTVATGAISLPGTGPAVITLAGTITAGTTITLASGATYAASTTFASATTISANQTVAAGYTLTFKEALTLGAGLTTNQQNITIEKTLTVADGTSPTISTGGTTAGTITVTGLTNGTSGGSDDSLTLTANTVSTGAIGSTATLYNLAITEATATNLPSTTLSNDLTITSGGNITQDAIITVPGTLSLSSGGYIDLTTAGNAIGSLGIISRADYCTIHDSTGGLTVSGAVTGGTTTNAVTITTAGSLAVNANVSATGSGNKVLLTGTDVTIGTVTVTGEGGATIDARTGTFTASASATLTNGANASAPILITANDVSIAASALITAGSSNVTIIPSSVTTQGITLGAATALGLADTELNRISTSGTLMIGGPTQQAAITVGGAVTLSGPTAPTGSVVIQNTTGGITISGLLSTVAGLTLTSTGNIAVGAAVSTGGNLGISASGTISGTGLVTVNSGTGTLTATALQGISLNNTADSGNLAATVSLTNGPAATGDIVYNSNQTFDITASNTAANGSVTITNTTGDVTVSSITSNNGAASVTASAGDILCSVINAGTGNVTLTATTGSVTDSNDPPAGTLNITANDLSITALHSIGAPGNPLETSVASIALSSTGTSGTNNIYILEANAVTINTLNHGTSAGDVSLATTAGTVTVTGPVTKSGSGFTSIAAGGATSDISLNTPIDGGSGNIVLNAGNIISLGSATAPDMTTTAGTISFQTPVVLSGNTVITRGAGAVTFSSGIASTTNQNYSLTLDGTSGGDVTFSDTVGSGLDQQLGAISISTGAAIAFNKAVTSSSNLTIHCTGLSFGGAVNISSTGTLSIFSNTGAETFGIGANVAGADIQIAQTSLDYIRQAQTILIGDSALQSGLITFKNATFPSAITGLTGITVSSYYALGTGTKQIYLDDSGTSSALDVNNGTGVTLTLNTGPGGLAATGNNAQASIANAGPTIIANNSGGAADEGTSGNRIRFASGSGAVRINNANGSGNVYLRGLGNLTIGGAASATGDRLTVIDTLSGGNLTVSQTLGAGTGNITLSPAGSLYLNQSVTTTTGNITLSPTGSVYLNYVTPAYVISQTTGNLTVSRPVILQANAAIRQTTGSSSNTILFDTGATINSPTTAHALTVTGGGTNVTFTEAIGAADSLSALTVTSAGTVTVANVGLDAATDIPGVTTGALSITGTTAVTCTGTFYYTTGTQTWQAGTIGGTAEAITMSGAAATAFITNGKLNLYGNVTSATYDLTLRSNDIGLNPGGTTFGAWNTGAHLLNLYTYTPSTAMNIGTSTVPTTDWDLDDSELASLNASTIGTLTLGETNVQAGTITLQTANLSAMTGTAISVYSDASAGSVVFDDGNAAAYALTAGTKTINVRAYTSIRSFYAANAVAEINTTGTINLDSIGATGTIGTSVAQPLQIQYDANGTVNLAALSPPPVTTAPGGIWIQGVGGNLNLGTVQAGGAVYADVYSGGIIYLTQNITSNGTNLTYNQPVRLRPVSSPIVITTGGGNLTFSSTLDEDDAGGVPAGTNSLTITAGGGNVTFTGEVGGNPTGTRLSAQTAKAFKNLSITSANSVTISRGVSTAQSGTVSITHSNLLSIADASGSTDTTHFDLDLDGAFTELGTGTVSISGDIRTTGDIISFAEAPQLIGYVALDTTSGIPAGATITLSKGMTTDASAHDLVISAGTGGDVSVSGSVGATGAGNAIRDIQITSAHDISFTEEVYARSVTTSAETSSPRQTSFAKQITTTGAVSITGYNVTLGTTGPTGFKCINAGGAVTIAHSGSLTINDADGAGDTTNYDIVATGGFTDTELPGPVYGTTSLQGDIQTGAAGNASFANPATLTGNFKLDTSAGSGTVSFADTAAINDDGTARDFILSCGTGNASFGASAGATHGPVGNLLPLKSLYITTLSAATVRFYGNVTVANTAGSNALYFGGQNLTFDNALTANTGNVAIANAGTLTTAATNGTITLSGASATFNQTTTNPVFLGGNVTTTNGTIDFKGPITLNAGVQIDAGTKDVTFGTSSTISGNQALTVNSSGTTTFNGSVGATPLTALASITTNAGGTTVINGGAIATVGAQTYNDAVVIGNAATITETNAGQTVRFLSTVDGDATLTLNATGATTFSGAVGAGVTSTNGLGPAAGTSLIVNSAGTTTFSDTVTTTTGITQSNGAGLMTFHNSVTVVSNSGTASAFNANVTFDSTTGSGILFTSANNVTFGSALPAPVDSLTIATQSLTLTLTDATASPALNVNATVDGQQNLTLNTKGTATFNAAIGSNVTYPNGLGSNAGASLEVQSTGDTTFNSTLKTYTGISQTGAGKVTFRNDVTVSANTVDSTFDNSVGFDSNTGSGISFTSEGKVTFGSSSTDALTLASQNVTLLLNNATATSAILTVNATVTGAQNLTLNTNGTTTFNAAVGSPTPIGTGTGAAIAINSAGATTFESTVAAANGITQAGPVPGPNAGPVTFNGDVTISGSQTASSFGADLEISASAATAISFSSNGAINIGYSASSALTIAGSAPVTIRTNTSGAAGAITLNSSASALKDLTIDNAGVFLTMANADIALTAGAAFSQVSTATGSPGRSELRGSLKTDSGTIHFATDVYIAGSASGPSYGCTNPDTLFDCAGNLFIAAGTNTVTFTSAVRAANLVAFSGAVNLATLPTTNPKLETNADLVLFGSAYGADDTAPAAGGSGISGLFTYNHAQRTAANHMSQCSIDITGIAATPGGTAITTATYNMTLPNLAGKTIKVGKNFYANGIDLNPGSTWTLAIPDNGNATNAFAEAYNLDVANCDVQINGAGSFAWVSAAENCTLNGGTAFPAETGSTGWSFIRPYLLANDSAVATGDYFSGTYTIYDDVVRVEFYDGTTNRVYPDNAKLIENTNGEISAALANISFNDGAIPFTGVFKDPACTVPATPANVATHNERNETDDLSVFYLKTNPAVPAERWNTDATGISTGDPLSTDRGRGVTPGTNRSTRPNIDIPKALGTLYASLKDEHKNRIGHYEGSATTAYNAAPGDRFTAVADRCRPTIVAVTAGQALHELSTDYAYDAHNYFNITWSEPVTIGTVPAAAANERSTINFDATDQIGGDIRMDTNPFSMNTTLYVSGYFYASSGSVSAGVRDGVTITGSTPAINDSWDSANSLYRANSHSLRIYLAGYAYTLPANPRGWKWYWPGYIDSITSPATATVMTKSNSYITDLAASAPGHNVIEPYANDNAAYGAINSYATTYAKAAVTITPVVNGWDTTFPDLTAYRSLNGWDKTTNPLATYEASPLDSDGNGFVDRVEMHVFDDTPAYVSGETDQWVSSRGWYTNGDPRNDTDLTEPVTALATNVASAEARGGIRGASTLKSLTGTAVTQTTDAFSFRVKIGTDPLTTTYTDPAHSSFGTAVSSLFFNPAGTIDTLDDPYFTVYLYSCPWRMTEQLQISYSDTTGHLTDLAGLRLKSFAARDCIDKTPPRMTFTIQPMTMTSLYILFSKPVLLAGLQNHVQILDASGTNLVNTGTAARNKTNLVDQSYSWDAIIELNRALTLAEITSLDVKPIPVTFTDPDTGAVTVVSNVFDELGNRMVESESHSITDLGINLATPLYASDGINTDGTFGEGEGALRTFDGTGRLLDRDITLAGKINPGTSAATDTTGTLQVFFDVDPAKDTFPTVYNSLTGSSLKLWLPSVLPSFNDTANFAARSLNTKTTLDANQNFRNFLLPSNDSEFVPGAEVQFIFKYGDLYCARLLDPTDITSVDPWRFKISVLKLQRGGVTILNNVINSNKKEKTLLNITLAKSGNLVIQVFTLDGNVVRTLERNKKGSGTYTYTWDGTNLAGNGVARGMYFIRVIGPDIDEIRKVMVVKE